MSEDVQAAFRGAPSAASDNPPGRQWLVAAAMLLMSSLAQADLAISPFTMSAIIARLHVAENVGVLIMTMQLGAFALAAFACSAGLDRLRTDWLGRGSAVMVLICQVLSAFAPTVAVMMAARTLVGLGEGLCVGIAYTWLSQQDNCSRLLSNQGLVSIAACIVLGLAVPEAVGLAGPWWGVLLPAIVAAAVGLLPASLALPAIRLAVTGRRTKASRRPEDCARLGQAQSPRWGLAMAMIFAGMISANSNLLWLYSAQLGIHDGLNVLQVSVVNASCSLLCLVCPPLAYQTSRRWGELWPMLILSAIMGVTGWYFVTTRSALIFVLSTYGNNIAYLWASVLLRIACAETDRTGRSTAAVVGADSVGWVLGPLVAGIVGIFWPGLTGLGVFTVLTSIIAGVAIWLRRGIAPSGPAQLTIVDLAESETVGVEPGLNGAQDEGLRASSAIFGSL